MARQSKVLKHGLAEFVLERRQQGKTCEQIAKAVNARLKRQRVADTLTAKAIERHFATLDKASAVEAHVPETAAANATLAVDVAARLNQLDSRLAGWFDEADKAVSRVRGVVWDEHGQEVISERFAASDAFSGPVVDLYAVDWQARTSVARELRETAKTVVDLLERVHNAEQIETFQRSVVEAIREADPDTARRVVEKMRDHHSIRRAALLGAAA